MEKISIVIVTVGADQTLVECLASLRRHTHSAHEIILVNNGCDSLDIVGAADLKIIENGRNLGFARAVNRGLIAQNQSFNGENRVVLVQIDIEYGSSPRWKQGPLGH